MVEDYKKYYYGRTDMTMLNDEKVYGSLGINLKEVTTIVEGYGSVVLHNSLKKPFRKFELLGNSTQGENPAPDNPQEIKSAGRKSKNIFNINYFKDKSNLQTIHREGFTLLGITCNVKPNTNYTLSARLAEVKYNLNIANKGTRFSLTSSPTRTLMSNDDGTLYIGFYGATADNVNMDDFMRQYQNIQLEEGIAATDYEPYGYFFDVKVTGKNLFDIEKAKDISNYTNSTNQPGYVDFSIYVGKGSTVTISYLEKLVANLGFYAGIAQTVNDNILYWLYHSSQNSLNKNTFKLIAQYDYICLRILKSKLQLFFDHIKTLQIEIGSKQTEYEPYTEQTMQITLDEPLRGIGDYKDVLTKDGVVRKIKRIMFDENTPFKEYNAPVQVKTTSFISGTAIKDATGETGIEVMSDRFKAKDRGFDRHDEECITLFGKNIFVRFNKDKNINTAEALTEWLKQNPLTVDYVLAEPVTEPLPESVQQQLQALHSENGTTHVFVDSGEVPCGINIEYVVGA